MQGSWTQSLVGELRSHVPSEEIKKKKKIDCRGALLQLRQQEVLTGKTSSSKDELTIASPGTRVPHFIALCFIVLHRCCVLYRLKVCGNPVSSESFSTISPTAFAHFLSQCHMLVILTFQTLSLRSYLLRRSVMLLLWLAEGSDDG